MLLHLATLRVGYLGDCASLSLTLSLIFSAYFSMARVARAQAAAPCRLAGSNRQPGNPAAGKTNEHNKPHGIQVFTVHDFAEAFFSSILRSKNNHSVS